MSYRLNHFYYDEDRDVEYEFDIPFEVDEDSIVFPEPRDIQLVQIIDHSWSRSHAVPWLPTERHERDLIVVWFVNRHHLHSRHESELRNALVGECWCEVAQQEEIARDAAIEREVDKRREGVA